ERAPESVSGLADLFDHSRIGTHATNLFSLVSILRHGIVPPLLAKRRNLPLRAVDRHSPNDVCVYHAVNGHIPVMGERSRNLTLLVHSPVELAPVTPSGECRIPLIRPHELLAVIASNQAELDRRVDDGQLDGLSARMVLAGAGYRSGLAEEKLVSKAMGFLEKLTGRTHPTTRDCLVALAKKHGIALYAENGKRLWP
ncbi:MAG: hypothetical protein Q8P02_04280, partial [Candidatus Micrarchaeota archaeon]|nr:hypothetical protein [Candidatus Micrarchaeota archaeon]